MTPQLRLAVLSAVVVAVLVVVAVVLFVRGNDDAEEQRQQAAGIEGLRTFSDLSSNHVPGPVDYPDRPPAGGDHFEVWLQCGIYTSPVPDEAAVHDLEHGVIWIAYDPDAATPAFLETLTAALPEQGIMTPYPGLRAPVVVSAWERQLDLDDPADPRLQEFVDAFESGVQAPERDVGCQSGATLEQLLAAGSPPAPSAG